MWGLDEMKCHAAVGRNEDVESGSRAKSGLLLNLFRQGDAATVLNLMVALNAVGVHRQSKASGIRAMFFSPAAFFSAYFCSHASQCFPAARSLPLNSMRAMSA